MQVFIEVAELTAMAPDLELDMQGSYVKGFCPVHGKDCGFSPRDGLLLCNDCFDNAEHAFYKALIAKIKEPCANCSQALKKSPLGAIDAPPYRG